MESERPRLPVGVNVFCIRDGHILLGRRKGNVLYDGQWGMPGGHLEIGEKMRACAARELSEETGMTAAGFEFVNADNDTRQDGTHYVHFGFRAIGLSGEPENCEPHACYGWGWFPLDALPEPLFFGHKKLLHGFLTSTAFLE